MRQLGQAGGQVVSTGHPCASNKDRDDTDVTLQRRFNLHPYEVSGIIRDAVG